MSRAGDPSAICRGIWKSRRMRVPLARGRGIKGRVQLSAVAKYSRVMARVQHSLFLGVCRSTWSWIIGIFIPPARRDNDERDRGRTKSQFSEPRVDVFTRVPPLMIAKRALKMENESSLAHIECRSE